MLEQIKNNIYMNRINILYNKGLKVGKIVPFDDNLYDILKKTYISSLPVSIWIKYLEPIAPPGKCMDRSLYMFFSLENSLLVRGDSKYLELRYGKENAFHGWIELDNYVYDSALLMRFEKDLYYQIYTPTNVNKHTIEDYCLIEDNKKLYDDIKHTTIEDFKTNELKQMELKVCIPLVCGIAEKSNNVEFVKELNDWLSLIDYDEITKKKK